MDEVLVGALQKRLSMVLGRYTFRFAHKPRITRNLHLMDAILADLDQLAEEAESADAAELVDRIAGHRATYAKERAAIVAAKATGPQVLAATRLDERAGFVASRYDRHFARRDRASRDLALLRDLQAAIAEIRRGLESNQVPAAAAPRSTCERRLELYEAEHEHIAELQDSANSAQQLGRLVAAQAQAYTDLFAGRSRLTVRAERLDGIVRRLDELRRLLARLAVRDGEKVDLSGITEQIVTLDSEVDAIRTFQGKASVSEQVTALSKGVGEVNAAYGKDFAGRDRASRDLEALGRLCDRLGELEMVLTSLPEDQAGEVVAFARDALANFEREYQMIRDARLQ